MVSIIYNLIGNLPLNGCSTDQDDVWVVDYGCLCSNENEDRQICLWPFSLRITVQYIIDKGILPTLY